jgi:hypothetical protein
MGTVTTTMLSATQAGNLSVVMAGPIPWYGTVRTAELSELRAGERL